MGKLHLLMTKSPFIMSFTMSPDVYPSTMFKLGPGEQLPAVLLTPPCTIQTPLCCSSVDEELPKGYCAYHESLRRVPYIMVFHSFSTVKCVLTITSLGLVSYTKSAPVRQCLAGIQGSSEGKVLTGKTTPPYSTNM
jgi:hypothetical protein